MNKETQTFYNLACNSAVDLIERNVTYNTIVCFAIYNPSRDKMYFYDILRRVYGYTATSAQHIAKFKCDYSIGKTLSRDWQDSHNIYATWRAI